ncbi:MAG: O-antigen ligase family protein [Terriglobia bacterium]
MKKIAEWGLLLITTGSVLAFGGVQSHAYSAMEVALFFLILVVLVRQTIDGKIDLPLPLWILPFLCLVLLQTIPLPLRVVSWLSPNRLFPGLQAALTLGAAHWATLSLYPHDTLLGFFKLLAYLAAFVLAAYAFEAREGKNVLTPGLIVLGSLEAAYGMVQYLTGYQKIFGFTKQFYTDEATGTYINHNHFAGFLELVIPFAAMMVFYNLQSRSAHGVPERQRLRGGRYSLSLHAPILFYVFIVILLLIAVVFSRSRMGIFSVLASLILMAFLGRLGGGRRAWMVITLLVIACSMTYAVWIGIDPVISRFEALTPSGPENAYGRAIIWKQASGIIRDYPTVGTGLGTFVTAFRRYQTTSLDSLVDHAHNDYLEVTADTGILGAALLFIPIIGLLFKMILAYVEARNPYRRSVLLACIGGSAALLIHSVADFNLQIPANALLFAVILGIGSKATYSTSASWNTRKEVEISSPGSDRSF